MSGIEVIHQLDHIFEGVVIEGYKKTVHLVDESKHRLIKDILSVVGEHEPTIGLFEAFIAPIDKLQKELSQNILIRFQHKGLEGRIDCFLNGFSRFNLFLIHQCLRVFE